MATQAQKLVRIERGNSHKTVTEADFKHRKMGALDGQTYQDAGYEIVGYEDGTPYAEGSEPTQYALAHGAPEIGGSDNTGHTTMDGDALTAAQKRDAGLEDAPAAAATSTPTRTRTAPEVATPATPEQA